MLTLHINVFCGNIDLFSLDKFFFSFLLVLMISWWAWSLVVCPLSSTHPVSLYAFPLQWRCVSASVFQQAHYLTNKLTRPPKSPFSAFPILCKMLIYRLLCPTRFHPPQLYFSSWYVRHVYLRAFLTPCGCSFRGCISQLAKRRQTNHDKQETIVL